MNELVKNNDTLNKTVDELIEKAKTYGNKSIEMSKETSSKYCSLVIKLNKIIKITEKKNEALLILKDIVSLLRKENVEDCIILNRLIINRRDTLFKNLKDMVVELIINTNPEKYCIDLCNNVQEPVKDNKSKEIDANAQKETTVNTDINAARGITPSSIASVFTNNPQQVEQHKCSCGGHCGDQNHACTCEANNNHQPTVNASIHPELNISQKVDLLKRRITFIPAKVDTKEIDALLWMLEGKMLNSKLMEYQATTGNLIQKADINFDKSQYNFAFEAESNIPGKRIIVLFNTNATIIPEINQYGYALNIYLDNK